LFNAGHNPTDILNARMTIEGEVAALAAANASERDIEAAADAIGEMIADHGAGGRGAQRTSHSISPAPMRAPTLRSP
jgi:DNA-binding FadR family transcriptional regulator